jgi:hypothetical protein
MKLLAALAVIAAIALQGSVAKPIKKCVVDVVFCIDNSGSIGNFQQGPTNPNWDKQMKFVQDLVEQMNVGPSETHVAVVDYGTYAYDNFDLDDYSTEAQVKAAIGDIKYKGESTNTTGGLWYSREILTNPKYGRRGAEVPKVIILITDGNPNEQVDTLDAEVANIRAANIRVVGVGVTDGVSEETMLRMVSSPADYIHAKDFSQLDAIKDKVVNDETCSVVTAEPTLPPRPPTEAPAPPTKPPTRPPRPPTEAPAPPTRPPPRTEAPKPTQESSSESSSEDCDD